MAKYFCLALLCLGLLLPVQAVSAVEAKKEPNPKDNAGLAAVMTQGVRAYYMGNEGGVDGWFLIKDGQIQFAYTLANGQNVILGALLGKDGQYVTALQVDRLASTHPELLDEVKKSSAERGQSGMGQTMMAVDAKHAQSPGEKLLHELDTAKIVALGNASAPAIYMVMDPNCPHCKATWRLLRDFVMTNKLRLLMIPIAEPGSDNERAAAQLLRAPQPMTAWDSHVGGDKNALAGAADPALIAAVQGNHIITDRWKIDMTPFIVYRAQGGQVKIVKGEIKQLAAVVVDLGL